MLASICWSELLAEPTPLRVFTPAEAAEIVALANAILPETDTPGATQADAVRFIDAALAGFDSDQLALYRRGLKDLGKFAALSPDQRIARLKTIEKTEFFDKLRTHTILAYFGNPQFGWKLLRRDPAMHFDPPFGFYDAEVRFK